MLLYLTIAFLFCYHTNAHGIIMDFTLNTILGEARFSGDGSDCATLLARSCFFVSRGNHKRLSLGWAFRKCAQSEREIKDSEDEADKETCVISFQKRSSKTRGNKVLGSGLFSFMDNRESFVVCKEHVKSMKDDDDETASTVDMDEDEFPVAVSSTNRRPLEKGRTVKFEEDLVTAVYTRPRTSKDDKYYLHYDEYDYMDFKLEYRDELLQQRQKEKERSCKSQLPCFRRSPRKVSFKREVVESVHPVMDRSQRKEIQKDLFYTEEEMRSFLDEFVVSLQKQQVAVTS
mmetsp:Transcript_7831/g.19454  ORF Transcript_7831/g.19454 Transcript_7831/m.19454 type:complete len:288 (+) Transcript_7831:110-973(+)